MKRHFFLGLGLALAAGVAAAWLVLLPLQEAPPAIDGSVGTHFGAGRGGREADLRRESEHLLERTPRLPPHPGKKASPAIVADSGHLVTALDSRVWVAPGLAIRAEPRAGSALLATVDEVAKIPFRRRRGDHFEVRYAGVAGWVFLPGYDRGDAAAPPLGTAPEPPLPLPPREPDAALLARAREALGTDQRSGRLGPYELHTDSKDPALAALLASLAVETERVYRARYGRTPVGEARGAVVLFESEGAYRIFQLQSENLAGVAAAGHNDRGVVALYVGGRRSEEVGATLVHELGHLLNRRALGPALPPWLDEGLCEDLAFSRIEPNGRLVPAEIGGLATRRDSVVDFDGPLTAFHRLRAELLARYLPTFVQLSGPDWPGFTQRGSRRASYDLAGAFVRYLIDGENGRRAAGLRAFLAGVARGESPEAPALFAALGEDAEVVEAGFRAWLFARANALLGPP